MKTRDSELAIFGALFSAQLFFGAFPVLGKVALASIPPLPFAFFRVAGASLILGAIARFRPPERVDPEDRPRLWLLSFLGVSVNQIFYITGLSLSTAINAAILMTTIPVLTLAIAIMARREAASPRKLAGCALALAGAFVLVGVGRFDWRSDLFLGDVLLLTNAGCYSAYLVLSRDLLKKYSPATFIRTTFVMGSAVVLVFAALPIAHTDFSRVPAVAWICLAAVIVFASVLAYLLNAWALARTHASHVAIFVALQPAVATSLAIAWLGEIPGVKTGISAALIFAGLFISRARLPRRSP